MHEPSLRTLIGGAALLSLTTGCNPFALEPTSPVESDDEPTSVAGKGGAGTGKAGGGAGKSSAAGSGAHDAGRGAEDDGPVKGGTGGASAGSHAAGKNATGGTPSEHDPEPEAGSEPPPPVDPCASGLPLSREQFTRMFPVAERAPLYAHALDDLNAAAAKYPTFAKGESCGEEVTAFLASVAYASQNLRVAEGADRTTNYCDNGGCGDHHYYGRGPIMLSWNYNYAAADSALDQHGTLLNDPDRLIKEPLLTWQTALWFWMQAGATSAHAAIVDQHAGIGGAIRSLDSAECQGDRATTTLAERLRIYNDFARDYGLTAPVDVDPWCLTQAQ